MDPLIFLSYASRDKLIADAICSRLENQNIRCWIAPRDVHPGADYSNQIADALERSTAMVMVFSSGSNASRHVKSEIDRAFSLGKVIIPFRVEDVELDKGLAYYLSKTHWLDALTKPLDQHIDRLAGTIRKVSGIEPPPVPLAQPVPLPPAPAPAPASKIPWIIGGVVLAFGLLLAAAFLLFSRSQRRTDNAPQIPSQAQHAPLQNPSASGATVSTSPPSALDMASTPSTARPPDKESFVGTWKIADAAMLNGVPYDGTVAIASSGSRYHIKWNSTVSTASGIGLASGNQLCVAYSAEDYGVVIYRIGGDGTLKGRWAGSTFSANDRDGLENATGGTPGKVEGTYDVKGLNPDGTTSYQGRLTIEKTGETYQLQWEVVDRLIKGVGIKSDDALFVAWGYKEHFGVAAYRFEGSQAKGAWTVVGATRVGTENLTK
ncbi:MAG TPA: toll/interleukin-1 receptor domain-containing protein [Chthoniobacterales bacterium]|jgi:hypothetical protein|nr:toll/interleukin-1 receptor domain-containing protein [Chthoniobacterales bacterium]